GWSRTPGRRRAWRKVRSEARRRAGRRCGGSWRLAPDQVDVGMGAALGLHLGVQFTVHRCLRQIADARSLDPGLGRGVTRQARDVLDRARCVEDARFGEVRAYGMDGSAAGLPQVRVALVDPGKELQLR